MINIISLANTHTKKPKRSFESRRAYMYEYMYMYMYMYM